jgi:hypothetical protein
MNGDATPSIQGWDDFVQWLAPHLKNHYSVDEFAQQVNRRPFTVREWCRLGRINAGKSMTHSGAATLWVISRAELERFRREGLLPLNANVARAAVVPPIVARLRRSRRTPAS